MNGDGSQTDCKSAGQFCQSAYTVFMSELNQHNVDKGVLNHM